MKKFTAIMKSLFTETDNETYDITKVLATSAVITRAMPVNLCRSY